MSQEHEPNGGEPLNPYAVHQPLEELVEPLDQTIDDETTRYPFRGAVRRGDVRRAFRKLEPLIGLGVLAVLIPMLMVFGFSWGVVLGPAELLVLISIPATAAGLGVWWTLGGNARNLLQRSPLILGELHGFLSPHRLVVHRHPDDGLPGRAPSDGSPALTGEYLLSALLAAEEHRGYLLLSFDTNRIAPVLLPLLAFAEEQREDVRQLLLSKAAGAPPQRSILDPRLIDNAPMRLSPRPPGAVAFGGEVLGADLKGTPLGRSLRRHRIVFLTIVVIGLGILAKSLWQWDASHLLFGLMGCLALLFGVVMLRWLAKVNRPDQPLFRVAGWMTPERIHTAVATGSTIYTWAVAKNYAIAERAITLQLPGRPSRHVVLARRLFHSDEDWRRACDWTRAGMEASRHGSPQR